MPMYDEYVDDIKSDMAELKNSGSRFGGVSTSAKFIEHFTEGYPWAHLDIASMVWAGGDKDPAAPKGATRLRCAVVGGIGGIFYITVIGHLSFGFKPMTNDK